ARTTATGTHLAPERRTRTRPASDEGAGPATDVAPGPAAVDEAPADGAGPTPVGSLPVLEIEDGETTLFEAAIGAYHAGEYTRAESLFLEEASRALDDAPQRAAIAYRQAALAARDAGNLDGSDHWMRLAGREYLRVSEDAHTPLPFIREAAVMAAKCFLSVENLHVANKGLRRAQAIESVLRADDDLTNSSTGIQFRRDTAAPPANTSSPAGPDAPDRPAAANGDSTRGPLGRLRQFLPRRRAA
ncbi:MAG: hypothetical protein ACRDYE_12870, partial [Acidimicrobiales bacterium]